MKDKNTTDSMELNDRRIGFDRRQFAYSLHIPERRNSGERRSGQDRRETDRRPEYLHTKPPQN